MGRLQPKSLAPRPEKDEPPRRAPDPHAIRFDQMEMSMDQETEQLSVHHDEDVTIVTFNEEQILESTCIKELEEALLAIIDAWKRQNITLDFVNVHIMSSAFLGLLVKLQARVCEKGGHLTLKNIAPSIRKVFEITQLTKVFDIA